jgi:hypothetical protein
LGGLLLGIAAAWAQPPPDETFQLQQLDRLHLDDIHPGVGGEREVELYLRALTRYGDPVEHLKPVDLEVREDGEKIDRGEVSVTTLVETGRGVAAVLAIDVSRTMSGQAFQRSKRAALNFLERLGSYDRVAIVAFGGTTEVVASFRAAKGEARQRLEVLEVDRESLSTVLYDGVYRAVELIRQEPDLPRRSFVIVFSDGKDTGSTHTLEQAINLSQGGPGEARILVFSIGYAQFGVQGLDVLRRLSEETGADFRETSSTIHLNSFYDKIGRQMRQSYVVRFPADMDGEAHTIEVLAEGQRDARSATYPSIARSLWPWLVGGLLVLVVGALVMILTVGRAPGRLVFVEGPRAGETILLRAGSLRIGALPDNDVVLSSDFVGRYHARVHVEGRSVEIEDDHSLNGTYVNGERIETSLLRPGDRVRFADVEFIFER